MKKHTRIYMTHFGYTTADFIACEVCGGRAVDIHHVDPRGMGGSAAKDTVENLVALCRSVDEFTQFVAGIFPPCGERRAG